MLVYISVLTLLFSCIVLSYSLVFFGFGPHQPIQGITISPSIIVVVGLVITAINGIASSIISNQLGDLLNSSKSLSPILKVGIPLIVFLVTLATTIFIYVMNN